MKIVALEEHFLTPDVMDAWKALPPAWADPGLQHHQHGEIGARLADLGERRLADMDATGVDQQILSLTAPGLHSLEPDEAIALQCASNDLLAATVRRWPDRFGGFAALATPDPHAAAAELRRAVVELGLHGGMVFGRTRDRPLDHADNEPLLAEAAALRAPLYLHPQTPVPAVRDTLYGGFGADVDAALSTFALGWHYEAGVQILRLIVSGAFDRYPDLQIITGHWGEVVLFFLERIDGLGRVTRLSRPPSQTFREHVSITPSGMWSARYLRWAIEVMGPERIMFSSDYPYRFTPDGGARRFLEEADLTEADRQAIAHGNWERMVARIRRD